MYPLALGASVARSPSLQPVFGVGHFPVGWEEEGPQSGWGGRGLVKVTQRRSQGRNGWEGGGAGTPLAGRVMVTMVLPKWRSWYFPTGEDRHKCPVGKRCWI